MNLREVTIGRSNTCDIYLDPRCKFASSLHATIFYHGNQLMFKDTSTNGTLINNVRVHKRSVPINHGDVILIAGKYPLNWNQIDSFFPIAPRQNQGTVIDYGQRAAAPGYQQQSYQQQPQQPYQGQQQGYQQPQQGYQQPQQGYQQPQPQGGQPYQGQPAGTPNLSKWNWGAFFLTWIWGVFNGTWITLLFLVIVILYIIPIVQFIAPLAEIAFRIFLGVKGTEWAWKNKQWSSAESFEHTQSTWAKVGIGLFLFGIIIIVLFFIFFASAITALIGGIL